MRILSLFYCYAIIAFACEAPSQNKSETKADFFQVKPVAETQAVSADPEDDAADDPAFWYNASDPMKSLIIGSDKTNGVDIFDLDGNRLDTYRVGRINNVDVRQGFMDSLDIVGGSNRSTNSMDFWMVNQASLRLEKLGSIPSKLKDVYGFCLYRSPLSGDVSAFINSKTGTVEHWLLSMETDSLRARLVRKLELGKQVEGMVADDSLSVIYVGVEEGGVYRFGAEPEDSVKGKRLKKSGEENPAISYDVEGLTIYYQPGGSGYLIASSQGNNSYAVFERSGENTYLGSFEIVDGKVDGVAETDGIDVTHYNLGPNYPEGMFICQDGFNFEGKKKVAQNFKMVSWKAIEEGLKKVSKRR